VGKSGKNYTSALTLLLLALPKCPICVVAYSGAITMCGVSTLTTTTFNQYYDARIYLALVFSTIFIIYLVRSYFNKRHRIFPLLAASSGFLFLVIQSLLEGSAYYYIGGGLVWLLPFFSVRLYGTLFLKFLADYNRSQHFLPGKENAIPWAQAILYQCITINIPK
jgi:hypothetical protein